MVFHPFTPWIRSRREISYIKQALLRDMILTNYYQGAHQLINQYKQSLEDGMKSPIGTKRQPDNVEEVSRSRSCSKRRKLDAKQKTEADKNMRPDHVQSYEYSKNLCEDNNRKVTECFFEGYDKQVLQEYSHLTDTALGKRWYSRCEELVQFKQENGHCNVPHGYKKNKQLGAWVNTQRGRHRNSLLSKEFVECLEKLGFEWSPSNKLCQFWDQRFEDLMKYTKTNGHCSIPKLYNENKELALWALNQRYYFRKSKEEIQSALFVERKQRLIRIGFDGTYGNKISNH